MFTFSGVVAMLVISDYWAMMWATILFGALFYLKIPFTPQYFLDGGTVWDSVSMTLVYLSVWVTILMYLCSYSFYKTKTFPKYFSVVITSMLLTLILAFTSKSLMEFYIYFEASLIPIFFLVYGWGVQPERIEASWYMIFYTLFGSLPLLFIINSTWSACLSIDFFSSGVFMKNLNNGYLLMILAFLTKMPIYALHLWLPKVHVEAPLSGSMILAAVLLKLGGYGLIRVFSQGHLYCFYLSAAVMVGGSFVALSCLQQSDQKTLIAYSSVVHMSSIVASFVGGALSSQLGILLMMVGHGFCSSCLFVLAGLGYERLGSRSLFINKGLLTILPSFTLWWFSLCMINIAAPFSMNLFSEVVMLLGIVKWSWVIYGAFFFLFFLSSCYTLYLYSCVQHGLPVKSLFHNSSSLSEFLALALHLLPLLFSFLFLIIF